MVWIDSSCMRLIDTVALIKIIGLSRRKMVLKKKTKNQEPIRPLFLLPEPHQKITRFTLKFNADAYNKNAGKKMIHAENDAEAIASFLNEYKDSPETFKSYSKEVERLLLWCIHVGKTSVSNVRKDDLNEYIDFLKAPTPKRAWCGPAIGRTNKDGSLNEDWRPFVKALGNNSIQKVLRILDSFFNYLVQTNYLIGNPLAVDRRRKKRNKAKQRIIDRYLELDELQATLDTLSEMPENDESQAFQVARARYIILLLFYSGLRIAEAANHTMGHFVERRGNWFLRIVGKGKKLREIPVPDALRQALGNFRLKVGLPSKEPKFKEKTPLIPMQNLTDPISPRRINQILKWAFEWGAIRFEEHEPQKASKLRQASAHWLRHSYVTYLLENGAPLKVAQENAGHSNVGTTMLYSHVAQTDRFEATKGLSLKSKNKK